MVNPNKAHLHCSNPHCGPKTRHDMSNCIAYTGAKQGQYEDWWREPWNIHLLPSQCSKENNVPPKSHLAYACLFPPTVHQFNAINSSMDQSSMGTIQTTDGKIHANSSLMPDTNCHIWNTTLCDSVAQAMLPILDLHMPHDNTCHHDSGANHHVFHDRSAFKDYEVIAPLTMKGFGHNLLALAIGRGNMYLEEFHNRKKCSILLQNVLHILTSRTNLISGIQLDKSSIIATLGHNTVQLHLKNKVIVSGKMMNDMY
jgi:Pol polyprotein